MQPLRVLLVEDNALDAELIVEQLREEGLDPDVAHVQSRDELLASLEARCPDIILSDYSLPSFDGFEALEVAASRCPDVPFVFVSGALGDELATETLRRGATDYVLKHRLERLAPAVRRALRESDERARRKRAEAELRETAERLGLALEAARLGDWSWEAATDAVTLSERAAEILGVDTGRPLTWTTLREELHEDDRERARLAVEQAIAEASDYDIEYRVRPGGAERWVAARGRARYDGAGRALGMLGVVQDVTARRRAEAERERLLANEQEARRQAEEANRAKDEFLAMVSHELRTPLNSMTGWLRLLRTGKLDEATFARGLDTLDRNVKSQAQLIEDLLDVSRIISGKLRLDARPIEVAQVAEAALDAVRPTAEAKSIELRSAIDSSALTVLGDPDRLQQVIWNLLSNAIKFTPKGGRVRLVLGRSSSSAEIVVSDTGQGISPEFLPYVFERYRQADAGLPRQHGGLGLGLAIVRHIVELHGGAVEAASAGEGQGATFTVRLPVLAVRRERAERPGAWVARDDASIECPPSLRGVRVLAVDDEPDAREILEVVLQDCEAEVQTAASVAEALEVFDRWRPDVLVSDIGMPGEDGYSLIRKVRDRGPGRGGNVPAVALTAFSHVDDRMKALGAGFQMHVAKPVEPAELIIVLDRLVGLVGKF